MESKISKVLIIAEAGVNHNGNMQMAKKLIDAAVDAEVDIVKFQTFIAENVISKHAEKAEYQKQATGLDESQLEMVKKLQLSFDDFIELKKYCETKKIKFLSTPFDFESTDFLRSLNMGIWKIPSGEITNYEYLRKIGAYKEKVIFSTGMATLLEIENALKEIVGAGTLKSDITILHCNTEYPTPMTDVNLKAMLTIKETFGVNIGYSDHTLGIEVAIAAVALGASVIEKHFTLDKNLEGPDHKASLEPEELKQMVKAIRNIEASLGDGIKKPSVSETKNIQIARKSIHLKSSLPKGHVLSKEDLIMKRPGDGIEGSKVDLVLGKKLLIDVREDTKLKWEDLD